jgi:hypothetical protein
MISFVRIVSERCEVHVFRGTNPPFMFLMLDDRCKIVRTSKDLPKPVYLRKGLCSMHNISVCLSLRFILDIWAYL